LWQATQRVWMTSWPVPSQDSLLVPAAPVAGLEAGDPEQAARLMTIVANVMHRAVRADEWNICFE
jgi:hypothetical protein